MKAKTLLVLLAALVSSPVAADDFYKDKVVSIVTSTGAGGSYDSMARLFSRHMGRFIPGRPSRGGQSRG